MYFTVCTNNPQYNNALSNAFNHIFKSSLLIELYVQANEKSKIKKKMNSTTENKMKYVIQNDYHQLKKAHIHTQYLKPLMFVFSYFNLNS